MKTLLLLLLTASISTVTLAQRKANRTSATPAGNHQIYPGINKGFAAKTSATGDTTIMTHIGSTDHPTVYSYANDTGYVTGMNAWGDKGFAERYDVNPADSTIKVVGIAIWFTGTYNPASAKTVSLKVWSQGDKAVSIRPTIFNNGFPDVELASMTRNINQLGIATTAGAPDTTKINYFPTPTAFLTDSFFVGFTTSYTWSSMGGDTIAVVTNTDGERSEPATTTLMAGDTTINNVNATLGFDDIWTDNATGLGLFSNLYIFPIVEIGPAVPSLVHGISRGDFTFFGTFPNPAATQVNVKVGLGAASKITVDIMDLNGKRVSTTTSETLPAGTHVMPVNTSLLAAGQYVCIVRTSAGNGIASSLTVMK